MGGVSFLVCGVCVCVCVVCFFFKFYLSMLYYCGVILLVYAFNLPVIKQGMPRPTSDLIASAAAYPLQYQLGYNNIAMFRAFQNLWNLYM
jgi:hypothetical protein